MNCLPELSSFEFSRKDLVIVLVCSNRIKLAVVAGDGNWIGGRNYERLKKHTHSRVVCFERKNFLNCLSCSPRQQSRAGDGGEWSERKSGGKRKAAKANFLVELAAGELCLWEDVDTWRNQIQLHDAAAATPQLSPTSTISAELFNVQITYLRMDFNALSLFRGE